MVGVGFVASALAASPGAAAFEIKRASSGELVRWKVDAVRWGVDKSVAAVPGGREAVASAAGAWSERGGAPRLEVDASPVKRTVGLDGASTVFFAREGHPLAGDALAVTVLSFDEGTGEVLDADVILNGRRRLGRPARARGERDDDDATYDVARVMSHEMGHALGLGDEPEHEDAIMYPYVSSAPDQSTTPSSDDIAGLASIYEPGVAGVSGAGAHDTGGCSTARAATTRGRGGVLVALAAAAVALVVARGGRRRRAATGAIVLAAAWFVVPPDVGRSVALAGERARAHAHGTARDGNDPGDGSEPAATLAEVRGVRTTSTAGLFRSEIDLSLAVCRSRPSCPSARFVTWGGTLGGVRQEVGGRLVPAAGDHVVVTLRGPAAPGPVARVLPGPGAEVAVVTDMAPVDDVSRRLRRARRR